MGYRLSKQTILGVTADQVQQIITQPRYRDVVWTDDSLLEMLNGLGLNYTADELPEILKELAVRGMIDAVDDPEPFPTPAPPVLYPPAIMPAGQE